jgi:type II secretory pathway component PulM
MRAENQRLQQQILAQQQIHRHLREVAQQVDLLRQAGAQVAVEAVEPAAVIADSSQQLGLDTYIVRRQADAAGGIELELQQMPFDKTVYWLAVLQQQHAIVVIQLDVHRHAPDDDALNGTLTLSPMNRRPE